MIELDDRTHNAGKDAKRDEMLECAGYRTVRWKSKAKPDAEAIRAALLPALPASFQAVAMQQAPGTTAKTPVAPRAA